MDKKNLNLIVSTVAFVFGAVFILSYPTDITANVIGASGPGAGLTVVMGLTIIIAASALFMFTISHGDTFLERLVRETKNSEEIHSKAEEQDIKEEYAEKK